MEADETTLHATAKGSLDELTLAALEEDIALDISAEDESGNTNLHKAIIESQESVVDELLSKNVDIEIKNYEGETPLMVAVKYGNEVLVEKLIKKGANVDSEDEYYNTPLLQAVILNLECIVNQLLKNGASSSVENERNQTPLFLAAQRNIESVFDKLIEAGADVNFASSRFGLPIEAALTEGNLSIAKKLLANGASLDSFSVFSSLLNCHQKSFVILMDFILEKGFDVNAKGRENCSLLHIVAIMSNVSALDILLKRGANVNAIDYIGQTPLHYAVRILNSAVVKLLLEHKPDVNAVDINGDTPLSLAVKSIQVENIRLLLNAGADMNIPPNSERSALEVSIKFRTFSRKPLSYMLCARKMDLAKVCINLTQNDGICPKNFTTLCAFESNCLEELNRLKLKKFGDTMSLYSIFSEHNDPVFASNSDLEVYTKSNTLKSEFPLYAGLLRRKLKEGIKRNFLLDNLSLSVRVIKGFSETEIVLPNEASRKVLVILKDCDLINVKRAFNLNKQQ